MFSVIGMSIGRSPRRMRKAMPEARVPCSLRIWLKVSKLYGAAHGTIAPLGIMAFFNTKVLASASSHPVIPDGPQHDDKIRLFLQLKVGGLVLVECLDEMAG